MRLHSYVLLALFSLQFVTPTANADENPPFGYYGYRHHEMHSRGIIPKMIAKMAKSCCDGGKGGECRVTKTNLEMTKVFIDGRLCPISTRTTVRTDIELPEDVEAIACAAPSEQGGASRICPTIYCLAGKLGS